MYGTDVSTFPVLDMTGRTISGPRAVAECLLRRYMTPSGSLEYDRFFGFDLRFMLGGDFTDTDLRAIEAGAQREAVKDERIASAVVSIRLEAGTLKVRVAGRLATGEAFEFVLGIGQVTGEVLSVS